MNITDSPLLGLSQRLPPANIQAEQALLGALLANNKAYERVSEFLAPAFSVQSFLSKREHTAARQILLAFRDGRFRSFVDA